MVEKNLLKWRQNEINIELFDSIKMHCFYLCLALNYLHVLKYC